MHRYRILFLCALLLTGCGKSGKPAAESTTTGGGAGAAATISLADVAGTWDGKVTLAGNDTVITVTELTATAEPTGWMMMVANAKTPTKMTSAPVTSVVAAGDSLVVDAGPYSSVLRAGQQVTTHGVYRLQDGKLVGTVVATYPASGQMLTLHSEATRRAAK